jgi:hypothetical protein
VPDPLADLAGLEGVPAAVASARAAVDVVLRDRGLRQVSGEQSAAALLHGARASAALSDDPDRWLAGSVRVSTELLMLSELIRTAPGQAIARAHALVAYGEVPESQLGRVRGTAAVSDRMRGLADLLTSASSAPAVVLAAVAHAEVATVAPFGTADGLVARAVEHLVLIGAGVDARAVLVPEAGHLAQRDGYQRGLDGYRTGRVPAVRDWILHCAQALAYGAEVSPLAQPGGTKGP